MHWFYLPDINGKLISLPETESKHCTRVLRLQKGENVHVTNGKGSLFECRIIDDNSKRTVLEIEKEFEQYNKKSYSLHIAVAPTKANERFEWFLEKATEIGIDEITPLITKYSERTRINMERYNKVLESAMKQSYKAYHPQLNELISFSDFLNQHKKCENRFIAHCLDLPKKYFFDEIPKDSSLLVIIGPEGGFDISEINTAMENGFKPVSLGISRLRTETAALVACAAVATKNQY